MGRTKEEKRKAMRVRNKYHSWRKAYEYPKNTLANILSRSYAFASTGKDRWYLSGKDLGPLIRLKKIHLERLRQDDAVEVPERIHNGESNDSSLGSEHTDQM